MSISKKFYSLVLAIIAVFALVGCTLPTAFSRTVSEAEADLARVVDTIFFTDADLQVTSNLEFPTSTAWAERISFEWSTSNEAVISKEGKVTRPEYGSGNRDVIVKVVITAEYTKLDDGTFKLGTVSTELEWTFTVLEAGKVYTIADIKNDLSLVDEETEISFEGVVVGFSLYGGSHLPFVYDGVDGMYVFTDSPDLKVGDRVSVNGVYDIYYNLVQVGKDANITVLESGVELPEVQKGSIAEVVAAEGYYISETVGTAAGKVHNVDAKVVYRPYESDSYNIYLQDPFNGEEFIVHYQTAFDYVPGGAWESYLDTLKAYDGKYVNITVVNYDRKDNEERVCLTGYPIVEIEEPKLTDEQEATIIINNLNLSETCETELVLPEEATWEVVSGTGIEIVDGVAVVTQDIKDQEVVLKATVTFGEAVVTKEFVVIVKGSFIEILTPTQALEQVKNAENNGKEVYIRGEIAEGSKLDKYGNMDLVDYDGVTSINIYGSFGKDADGNYIFASIKEQLGLEVGVSVVLRGTYYTSKGNITGLEIVEVVPTPITPSEAYEAVQIADNNGKEVLIIGKITEDSKLDKYGNMILQDVNGTGTISIYGSFKDADGNYIFATIKEQLGLAAGKVVVLRGTYYNSKSNVTGLEIVSVVNIEVEEIPHEHVKCPICELCTDANCPGTAEDKCAGHEVSGETATVTVKVSDYATANGWVNSTLYNTMKVDSNVTIKVSGTPVGSYGLNSGKYYTSGNTWRIYQNESPAITFVAGEGCQIVSVKITYTVDKTGVLTLNGSNVESDTVVDVNASTITFSVGNTGTVTNGQVRITAVEVVYVGGASETPHEHEYVNGKCECGEVDPNYVAPIQKVTIAEASALKDGTKVAIEGVVSKITYNWSDNNGNMSVDITDATGTINSYKLTTKVGLGDTVIITGVLSTFSNKKQISEGATAEIVKDVIDITVYFKNGQEWTGVSVWAWNSNGNLFDAWPGVAATPVEGKSNWYSYTFFLETTDGFEFLFNGNSGSSQTSDFKEWDKPYFYVNTGYESFEAAEAAYEESYLAISAYGMATLISKLQNVPAEYSVHAWYWGEGNNGAWASVTINDELGTFNALKGTNGCLFIITEKGAVATWDNEKARISDLKVEGENVITGIEKPEGNILLATFDFGANGSAAHVDGDDLGKSKSYSEAGYSLELSSMSKVYGPAYDSKGNSCIKLGTSKVVGTFTFTVADDVKEVVIYVAGYKANSVTVDVNGTKTTISTQSNNGEYTAIKIDTTEVKTIVFTTSTKYRCMINTIEYYG